MTKSTYTKANKFHRIDRLQPYQKSRRQLANNYYANLRGNHRRIVIRIILSITIILIIQSFFQLPWLKIDQITINGLSQVPEQSVKNDIENKLNEKRFWFFKNNNYLLFSNKGLAQQLATDYYLEDITIDKKFPDELIVSAKERISPFIRQTPEAYYILSYSGETLDKTNEPPEDTSIIADERQDLSTNIPFDYLEKLTEFQAVWDLPVEQIKIEKFHLTDEPNQIIVSTDRGYRLIFSTIDDFQTQLLRLKEILKQNILPQDIEYVDLRYENNVYFK